MTYKLYLLVSYKTNSYYVGMTKNLKNRMRSHKHQATKNRNLPLYNAMNKYQDFIMVLVNEYQNKEECCLAEVEYIKSAREQGHSLLNISDGGETGGKVSEEKKEEWKHNLSLSRAGKQPSLGMKHTAENKEFFSACSRKRWKVSGTYPKDIIKLSFKEANQTFGISRTHYYRLLKRAKSNDLS